MEDKNSVLLFEYLRSILYDSEINRLDIDQLDEPFQKLGKGMQYLQEAVEEIVRLHFPDLRSRRKEPESHQLLRRKSPTDSS